MRFEKKAMQREERSIYGRIVVSGLSGTATSSSTNIPEGRGQLSALTTGTGIFTMNFLKPFVRTPVIRCSALAASAKLFCVIAAVSTSAVTINVFSDAGTATDPTGLHLEATGWDVADEI